jgi:hypothetical protein
MRCTKQDFAKYAHFITCYCHICYWMNSLGLGWGLQNPHSPLGRTEEGETLVLRDTLMGMDGLSPQAGSTRSQAQVCPPLGLPPPRPQAQFLLPSLGYHHISGGGEALGRSWGSWMDGTYPLRLKRIFNGGKL